MLRPSGFATCNPILPVAPYASERRGDVRSPRGRRLFRLGLRRPLVQGVGLSPIDKTLCGLLDRRLQPQPPQAAVSPVLHGLLQRRFVAQDPEDAAGPKTALRR